MNKLWAWVTKDQEGKENLSLKPKTYVTTDTGLDALNSNRARKFQ